MMETLSRTGASEARIGDSWSSVSPGGVHRELSQPIGMKTNPSRRTGWAAVFASGVAAGTIASSSGKAMVAPMPRRKVRRGMDFFVMKLMVFSSG